MSYRFSKQLVLVLAGLSLGACVSRSEVDELKKGQEKILTKLDELAKARPAGAQMPRRGPDPSKVYAMPVDGAAVKGPNDAWVTIVEVSDFQCPFCNRVNPTIKQIQEKYGNDVRVAFKHNPLGFHQRALPAALAAECGNEQGKFWQLHDQLFENQKSLNDEDFEKYAQSAGVDMKRWKDCYSSSKYKDKVLADQAKAVELGARGTPAFFINGRFLSGAQPFPSFQTIIDEELKKAKDSGVSKGDYYAKVVMEKGEKKM